MGCGILYRMVAERFGLSATLATRRTDKLRVRVLWEEWMIDEIDHTGLVYVPTREDISGWVAEVVWGLNGKNLK